MLDISISVLAKCFSFDVTVILLHILVKFVRSLHCFFFRLLSVLFLFHLLLFLVNKDVHIVFYRFCIIAVLSMLNYHVYCAVLHYPRRIDFSSPKQSL